MTYSDGGNRLPAATFPATTAPATGSRSGRAASRDLRAMRTIGAPGRTTASNSPSRPTPPTGSTLYGPSTLLFTKGTSRKLNFTLNAPNCVFLEAGMGHRDRWSRFPACTPPMRSTSTCGALQCRALTPCLAQRYGVVAARPVGAPRRRRRRPAAATPPVVKRLLLLLLRPPQLRLPAPRPLPGTPLLSLPPGLLRLGMLLLSRLQLGVLRSGVLRRGMPLVRQRSPRSLRLLCPRSPSELLQLTADAKNNGQMLA